MTGHFRNLLKVLPALCVLVMLPACRELGVRETAPVAATEGLVDTIERAGRAFVFVGGGAGAIISPDGYVITNAHVTAGSGRWRVRTADGAYRTASVVGVAAGTDLCLLKIDHGSGFPYLKLANSDALHVGDLVVAIGNPFGLGNIDGKPSASVGVVSALHVDRPYAYDAILTDAPINPGNSGGPLIDARGELVGVNAQIDSRFGLRQNTGVGYAISSNQVQRFLPALRAADGQAVEVGRIAGLVLIPRLDAPAVARAVRQDSAAWEAGLRPGDVITMFGRTPVRTVRDLIGTLGRYPVGVEVAVKVVRTEGEASQRLELQVRIDPPPRAYVGITFARGRTLKVEALDTDGPAARAGVHVDDVVVGIGDHPVRSRTSYYALLHRLKPGMSVLLTVQRNGQNLSLPLRVGAADPATGFPEGQAFSE